MSETTGVTRRVLITGATGSIGSHLAEALADEYDIVQHGRTPRTEEQEKTLRLADLDHYDAVLALMDGVDTVVHMAGAASPDSSWETRSAERRVGKSSR